MRQTIIPITFDENYSISNFIVADCNSEAYKAISKSPSNWPNRRLLIIGEEGSGKTHLTRIWQKNTSASYFSSIEDISEGENIILDDANKNYSETELFHIINTANEKRNNLLITTTESHSWQLPDLKSRINATYQVFIKTPDENFIKILLAKMFVDQQLKINREVLDFISMRIERNFKSIKKLFNLLNKLSMVEKKNITVPFAKTILTDLNSK